MRVRGVIISFIIGITLSVSYFGYIGIDSIAREMRPLVLVAVIIAGVICIMIGEVIDEEIMEFKRRKKVRS